jgi:hypothetical protein
VSAVPAHLTLRVTLRNGAVEGVRVVSPRVDPAPIFIGLSPTGAAAMAARLFSLCPAAQSLAAQAAGEAACGMSIDATQLRARHLKLLCERLGEMARASLLDWPCDEPPSPNDLMDLRDLLKILRAPLAAEPLRACAERLGLVGARDDSHFGRQLAEADQDDWELPPHEPDYLSADDDNAVGVALAGDSGFSRAPALPGRCVETGAAARQNAPCGALWARLAARRADMVATIDAIVALLDGEAAPELSLSMHGDGRGQGFAAVESARGRLYHSVRIDRLGRIEDYRIVAPTEWNFHPDGPFVRALTGAKCGEGREARRRIERLAFVFDPCIRASAEILDQSNA